MALVSPGVEVTVTNESAYVSSDPGTVPLIFVATAKDKTQGSGTGTAAGTTTANVDKTYLITSQRELVNTFGTPTFYKSTSGTMLHGYELNEYGLQAAYSYLGLANRAYVVRADVDLSEMSASATAPSGTPVAGTYWLDLTNTKWGIHEWNATTQAFTSKAPKLVTKASEHSSNVPVASFGSVGDYAVVTTTTSNAVYYKNRSNIWKLAGDGTATTAAHAGAVKDATWASSHPTITGTVTNPIAIVGTASITINAQVTAVNNQTAVQVVASINATFDGSTAGKTGISCALVDNKIELYAIGSAASNGTVVDGKLAISETAGTPLATLGLTAGTYASPTTQSSSYTLIPSWETSATTSRPTGSTWMKLDKAGTNATDLKFKSYSSTSTTWVDSIIYTYDTLVGATADLGKTDARTIAVGQLIADHDVDEVEALTLKTYRRVSSGATIITGSDTTPTFTNAETFTINSITVALGGTTATDFVAAVSAASITDVTAKVEASGVVSITHAKGGDLVLRDTSGAPHGPLVDAGITNALLNVYTLPSADLIGTNWQELTYEAKATEPTTNPATGRLWYDSTLVADIMVNDGTTWKGYRTVSADFRGYNLVNTDPKGPIFAAAAPTLQSDKTALVNGDLWVDTSDLENYPKISRYQTDAWVAIDNSDQVSGNGISFADARWQTEAGATVSGTGAGTASDIDDMLLDSFLDPDAPNPALFPRGALLFNTRRSGYGVKEYSKDAISAAKYPTGNARFSSDAVTDYYPDRWVNKPGNKTDGSPFLGRKAQRQVVVAALKSVINSNTDIREEQRQFNLIAAPGYPEALSNMATLNTDRKETAHIIADTPLRLAANAADLEAWSKNSNAATDNGEDGLVTNNEYMSVYYPSGFSSDLAGNSVVVPASHMMLRTFAYNDSVGFQWFAAAGTNRGKVTNASAIGYIDSSTAEFQSIAVREGLRDVLYANRVNPITFINGSGLMNFGNKSRASTSSAIDRVNVSRLVSYMRRQLDLMAKPFIFEPNDELTRNEIKGVIESFCNELMAKRALSDYLVVCDESNNTSTRIDRNELYVDVAIEPVKALEFIYIPVRLKNTGEIAAL
jgi:hypothetical protein